MGQAPDDRLGAELGRLRAVAGADAVEESRAHAEVQGALFKRAVRPLALGRYVLLHLLGRGGGGTVYRAYDPSLHRQVAIKLVQTGSDTRSVREDLLPEAQLIASVSHPNVVAVHDVGVIPPDTEFEDGIYIVMELLDGASLDAWLGAAPRSASETLSVLLAVAEGLAAAHERGVVHRDVKPMNVLVGKRVCVLDFGLARSVDAPRVRELAGTPPYMAPEQHEGKTTDPRTDQYGFCVMAYEALYGQRPFAERTADALLEAKRRGPPPPERGGAPKRVASAIMRGLSADPAARFEDMRGLIKALAPRRSGRLRWIVAAAALGVIAVAVGAMRQRAPVCKRAEARLAGVWDEDTRHAGQAAFAAAPPAFGDEAWGTVASVMDDRVASWAAEYRATCEDAPSHEAVAVRALCLDARLDELRQFAALLRDADGELVGNAVGAARSLRDATECRDAVDPFRDLELDPARRAKLAAVERDMQRARLLRITGKYPDAIALAAEVATAAETIPAPTLVARAMALRCRVAGLERRFGDAELLCHEALRAAERAGDAGLAAGAMLRLAENVGRPERGAAADWLYRLAKDRIDALPEYDQMPALRAWWAVSRGGFENELGNPEVALPLLEEARSELAAAVGEDNIALLPALHTLGRVLHRLGRLAESRRYYERALEITVATHGPQHPKVGIVLNNAGSVLRDIGRPRESADALRKALRLKADALGDASPLLATSHLELARSLTALGEFEEAREHAQASGRLHGLAFGETSEAVSVALAARSEALRGLGRCAESLDALREVEAKAATRTVESPFEVGQISLALGRCLRDEGDPMGARAAFGRALTLQELQFGPEHRALVAPLTALGTRADLRRAQAIVRATEGDPADVRRVEEALNALERSRHE